MKKLFLGLVVMLGLAVAAGAQTKAMLTAKIKTPHALCEDCKNRIETYLKRYDGVLSAVVNFRKGETTVKYLTDRTDIEQIKTAIANCGYDADDVPATEDAYNRLPKACKKPEDGGAHKMPKTVPPATPPTQ